MKIAISNAQGCARRRNGAVKPFHIRLLLSKILENDWKNSPQPQKELCCYARDTSLKKLERISVILPCQDSVLIGEPSINVILRPICCIILQLNMVYDL
jgi:hypothetical protein